jgi:hypothetical protein
MRSVAPQSPAALSIGELSRRSGVNIETIRYYERIKMLPAPPRTASGRRVYGPAETWSLFFIRRSRELAKGHQSLLHAPQRRRPRRPPGRRVVRIGLRVIDRHLAVSVEGNLARRPSTDNGRPTYRDGSGYAADRPKSRHIGLHGAGTRRPFGEMPPMRPRASIPGSSPGTVDGAPDR